ncbi:E3 ubiquitin-protein ligase UBR2-like isoform X3 [Ictalurus furcatus]|uniref:E3 ubiquitin-protein ligase UBR2-like isoform X3 n=1 Tax=Ictalurus furcatus TaxID=66913 RepID=UPI00235022E1|nr:E3 ubiquitin-protein ligase UBR2-like isoform X3 [Ictalurus furcatus]
MTMKLLSTSPSKSPMVSIKTMRECTAAAPPCEGTGHCHKETVWDKDKAERKRKAELCWKKTMAQTLESQSHFINKYIDLLTQDSEDLDASASTSAEHSPSSCDSALVCVGPRRWRARGGERRQMEMCILCHEAQEILPDGTTMVLAAFVQRSTVMSKIRKRPPHNPESYDPLFMHPDLSFGTHTGSCGHIMHSHCWQRSLNINDADREEKNNRYLHTSQYVCVCVCVCVCMCVYVCVSLHHLTPVSHFYCICKTGDTAGGNHSNPLVCESPRAYTFKLKLHKHYKRVCVCVCVCVCVTNTVTVNRFCVDLDVCFGSLSCWKIQPRPI